MQQEKKRILEGRGFVTIADFFLEKLSNLECRYGAVGLTCVTLHTTLFRISNRLMVCAHAVNCQVVQIYHQIFFRLHNLTF